MKTSANLVAIVNDSRNLTVYYNGALLLSAHFQWCYILINFVLFVSSTICLMALLFTLSLEGKMKLIKYHSILQLVLAFLILVLMTKLWFAPFKLRLNSDVWQETINTYRYKIEVDSGWGWWNLFEGSKSVGFQQYRYSGTVDRLQEALGCCGVSGPEDWLQNKLALLAPSCCSDPVVFGTSTSIINSRGSDTSSSVQPEPSSLSAAFASVELMTGQQVFYCQWFSPTSHKQGCQRFLSDRETLFIFNLRLSLLFLLTVLISTILASLSLYTCPSSRCRQRCARFGSQEGALNEIALALSSSKPVQVSNNWQRHSGTNSAPVPIGMTDIRLIQAVRSHGRPQAALSGRLEGATSHVTNAGASRLNCTPSSPHRQSNIVMTII